LEVVNGKGPADGLLEAQKDDVPGSCHNFTGKPSHNIGMRGMIANAFDGIG